MKKNDPTINPTSPQMTGWFSLPHFGDDETPEENEAFALAHLVNHGKTPPPQRGDARKIFRIWKLLMVIMFAIFFLIELKGQR